MLHRLMTSLDGKAIRLDYQFFVFLKRILPYRALNALIGLIYAK